VCGGTSRAARARPQIAGLVHVKPFGSDVDCRQSAECFDGTRQRVGLAPRDAVEHRSVSFPGGDCIRTHIGCGSQSDVVRGLIEQVRDGRDRHGWASLPTMTTESCRREPYIVGVNQFLIPSARNLHVTRNGQISMIQPLCSNNSGAKPDDFHHL
jgi:hypothetical protein